MAEVKYAVVLDEIRGQLARRHLTQQDLGRRAGIKQSTMSRRMTGETAFTIPELFDVCAVLGLSLTDLLVAADRNRPRPVRTEGDLVAGRGFEPLTSGLRERPRQDAVVIPFPRRSQTLEVAS